jgi:hypothetical protein
MEPSLAFDMGAHFEPRNAHGRLKILHPAAGTAPRASILRLKRKADFNSQFNGGIVIVGLSS